MCPSCGAPMFSECANTNCSVGRSVSLNRELKRKHESRTRDVPNQRNSRRRGSGRKKRRPDLSKPIPNDVNGADFVSDPKKSLLSFLGYSRAANQSDSMRQDSLNFIINADPLIPSDKNKGYLLLFGPQNSVKRIRRIIHILEKQVGAQFWVRKNPVKHAKKIPALEKAERDIVWLKQILKDKIQ